MRQYERVEDAVKTSVVVERSQLERLVMMAREDRTSVSSKIRRALDLFFAVEGRNINTSRRDSNHLDTHHSTPREASPASPAADVLQDPESTETHRSASMEESEDAA